jgi:ubiquinone/menaquinone biosynthesis C-methylase UbiE
VSLFLALIYDRFMAKMEAACGTAWRRELLAGLRGDVVELGAGTGRNLALYDEGLTSLTLAEPDRHMRRRLERALAASRWASRARVVDWPAERLALPDASVDAVVSTLVLCTVPDPARALAEARRVLRPDGKLIFWEHVASDDARRLAWQRRLEPIWTRLSDGCHLCRETERTIANAGFAFDAITRESARKALPIVRPTIRGVARPVPTGQPGSG